ncbi:MAG: hypothetical protein PHH85_02125 [Candidatus Methanoperedens sp.]|nr:hypothetical protein [Candidatus Methanoperedens sp.]
MPIIAESPPIVFGQAPTSTPTPTPTPTPEPDEEPTPTPTPGTSYTPSPQPTTAPGVSDFVNRHQQFIDRVGQVSPCFKREDLADFTDQEFTDHINLAQQDKFVAQNQDLYCSMRGVEELAKALKRTAEEQEII